MLKIGVLFIIQPQFLLETILNITLFSCVMTSEHLFHWLMADQQVLSGYTRGHA